MKSLALALASKVKSLALASKPQVLGNCPVLGSRTALFFEPLKLCITIIIYGQWCNQTCYPVADLENFGGGDFEHKTSKIRMSSPKLRVIFQPKSEIQTLFSPKIRWSPKKKGSSLKLRVIFQPKSEIQTFFSPKIRWSSKKKKKKKKRKVFTEIEGNFSAEILSLRLVGGDSSRNGAEFFEIEADFSAKIVTFRLVGGMHPPHSHP